MITKNTVFIAAYALSAFVVFSSIDMYFPALPTIQSYFVISQDSAQYSITIWFLGSASLQLIMGPLSDHLGHKKIFMFAIILFVVASFILIFTSSFPALLCMRFFQGMSVCGVLVAGLSTIHEIYSSKKAIQMIAMADSVTILAPALGPLFGSFIVTYYSWRIIFVVLAIFGIISALLACFTMPNKPKLDKSMHLKKIFHDYVTALKSKDYMLFSLTNATLTALFFIWVIESPFVIMTTLKKPALYYGWAQTFVFLGFILGAQISRALVNKMSATSIVKYAIKITNIFVLLFLLAAYYQLDTIVIIIFMVLISISCASCFGPLKRFAVDSVSVPMGIRVAIGALFTSLAGIAASLVITLFNNMTFFNMALAILCSSILALTLFSFASKEKISY